MVKEQAIDLIKQVFRYGFCSYFKIDYNEDGSIKMSSSGRDLHICKNSVRCRDCENSIKTLEDIKKLIVKDFSSNILNKNKYKYIVMYMFDSFTNFIITEEISKNIIETIFSLEDEDLKEELNPYTRIKSFIEKYE